MILHILNGSSSSESSFLSSERARDKEKVTIAREKCLQFIEQSAHHSAGHFVASGAVVFVAARNRAFVIGWRCQF
jgi:hypothetical protein